MALTERLAHLIAETTYEQFPVAAVAQAKRALLDTIGVTLAGHREDIGQIITLWVQDAGGSQEAAVLGTALYTSPALAAMANGTSASANTTWARFRATWAFISCSRAVASARRCSARARATRVSASA